MTLHASSSKTARVTVARTSDRQHAAHAREASAYYRKVRSRLFKDPAYRNKYVAIRDRKIVDVDGDKFVLHGRLLKTFPDHKFYVMPVWKEYPSVNIESM